jgi:hypothetical protein
MRTVTPEAVASALKDEFNIDMDIYTVVRHSAKALELLGMIAVHKVVVEGVVQNYSLLIPPPEVVKLSAVIKVEDYNSSADIVLQEIYHPPQIIFTSEDLGEGDPIDAPQYIQNYMPNFRSGYIDHVWDCPYLKFNETDIKVLVEYTTLTLDDNGYPKIPETVMDACVYWCLFKHIQQLYIIGKVGESQMERVTQWKTQKFAQSEQRTIMRSLSANEMNRVMNIMSSFDRKRVNIDV